MEFSESERMVLENLIHWRRDVRGHQFIDQPIPQEVQDRILTAGIKAPSVGYSQPARFITVNNPETKAKIRNIFDQSREQEARNFSDERRQKYDQLKLDGILEAPLNIAVYYQNPEAPTLGQTAMPEVGMYSVVCAIQNMWLMARAFNIGMGWVSILDQKKLAPIFKASSSQKLIAYLCLGYVEKFLPIPELKLKNWERQRDRNELIFKEHF